MAMASNSKKGKMVQVFDDWGIVMRVPDDNGGTSRTPIPNGSITFKTCNANENELPDFQVADFPNGRAGKKKKLARGNLGGCVFKRLTATSFQISGLMQVLNDAGTDFEDVEVVELDLALYDKDEVDLFLKMREFWKAMGHEIPLKECHMRALRKDIPIGAEEAYEILDDPPLTPPINQHHKGE